jgi:hypothetical protein
VSGQAKTARRVELDRRRRQSARLIAIATIPEVEELHCSACGGLGEDEPDEDGDGWCNECESWYEYSDEDGTCLNCGENLMPSPPCEMCGGSGRGLDVMVRAILGGERFDVHAARTYGERLVREGTAGLETWVVYLDWLRNRGWFEIFPNQWTTHEGERLGLIGGFPAEVRFLRDAWARGPGEGKRPRMDGAATLRMGRRLLAALEGQPSECQSCDGVPTLDLGRLRVRGRDGDLVRLHRMMIMARPAEWLGDGFVRFYVPDGERERSFDAYHEHCETLLRAFAPCTDCRGTGHNLAGVLAPVRWSTAVVVAVADSQRERQAGPDRGELTRRLYDSHPDLARLADAVPTPGEHERRGGPATRVVPRGQHRTPTCAGYKGGRTSTLDQRIFAREFNWPNPVIAYVFRADGRREIARDSTTIGPDDRVVYRETEPRWLRGERKHAEQRRARHRVRDLVRPTAQARAELRRQGATEWDSLSAEEIHDELARTLGEVVDNLRPDVREAIRKGQPLVLNLDDGDQP